MALVVATTTTYVGWVCLEAAQPCMCANILVGAVPPDFIDGSSNVTLVLIVDCRTWCHCELRSLPRLLLFTLACA
ncbi:hypothetical protein COO60DRAFT_1047172 [Scenedesmus sp. NREL 46B-D3]|nr:hypothetical protein COO60DRAFT_1047172 [Scenedesmus sp. NREL 46B-D3]